MMRRIIILLVFSFFYVNQYAQFKINNDKDFKNYSDSLLNYAHIPKPDLNKNNFEMRFWIIRYANFPHELFIFKYNKQKKWDVQCYSFCTTDWIHFIDLNVDSCMLSRYWDSRWDSLVANKVLQIPTESKVSKKWRASTGIIPIIADGVAYRVELFTLKGHRRYSYGNPESKLLKYDLNNKELVAFCRVINILNNELKFKEKLNDGCSP